MGQTPHLWSHRCHQGWQRLPDPGRQEPTRCKCELGGHERAWEAVRCLAAQGCCTDPSPACTAANKCCFAFVTCAETGSSFRSPVEIPQWHQYWGLRAPANLPAPSQELGRCHLGAASPLQRTSPGDGGCGAERLEEPGWGCTCPCRCLPSPRRLRHPRVVFQAPLPSFEWALPARPRNLPLSGTADERRDKFRKKSLCGSEEKHGGLGNPSCSAAAQPGLNSLCSLPATQRLTRRKARGIWGGRLYVLALLKFVRQGCLI